VPPHCLPSPHHQVSSSFHPGRGPSSIRGNLIETALSAAGRAIPEFTGGVPNRFPSYPGSNAYYDGYNARDETSEMGQSTRFGREDAGNVTKRDCKRPKERSRDRAYKARFSMDSSLGIRSSPVPPPPPLWGGSLGRGMKDSSHQYLWSQLSIAKAKTTHRFRRWSPRGELTLTEQLMIFSRSR
jgi:hypothetical protein